MDGKKMVVRFPPSPTGLLHMGNVRTALYNYLFAKQNGGQFIIRIEDTDRARSKKEYEEDIIDGLKWLNIDYDNKEEIWRQSERVEIYKQKMQELIKKGVAYISKETEGENKEVIRFKNPGGKIKFEDLIRGEVEIDVSDLGDFIIGRNMNEPLYHLAVVVDDMDAKITHIIRGEDHISNTPRQILILEALGGTRPIYAHLPLIFSTDKTKLSKRKHGESASLKYYRNKGYEAGAIINFMAMIGWNPGTDQEIFGMAELIKIFDIKKVQKKAGVFNIEKLDWLNREYLLRASQEIQMSNFKYQMSETKWKDNEKVKDKIFMEKFSKIMLDRIHRWEEVGEVIETGEYDYLFEKPFLEQQKVLWKEESKEKAKKHLKKVSEMLDSKEEIMQYAEEVGKGEVLWPLRYALSGREKSPDPFTLIDILGILESKERIDKAIEVLNKN